MPGREQITADDTPVKATDRAQTSSTLALTDASPTDSDFVDAHKEHVSQVASLSLNAFGSLMDA